MTRDRRAYIVLVIICLLISGASFVLSTREITANDRKFCDIVHFSLAVPAPKPADPKVHPSRERAYEGYQKVVRLSHSLGC